jgi:nucleotide-binding universal stress UspA family protein
MEVTKKVVVGVDNTDIGAFALSRALEIASGYGKAEVHVLRVIEPVVDPLVDVLPSATEEVERLKLDTLEAVKREIASVGALRLSAVVAHTAIGAPARCIVSLAAELDADLIVVGTHGRRGLRRAILGSVAEEVVRTAGCPVFCVRAKDHPAEARVPQIEPLCEDCAKTRFETKNEKLWCAQHASHHPRAHVYRYEERSLDAARPWGFHQ